MQDGNYNDSDDDKDSQLNPDDEQSEEEESVQSENPNSIIREAIKNMKKELSANHISGKNSNLKEKISKFPIIPLDKLSCFLLKFVKKANLSLYDRRILFAAITPIHHIYLHVISGSQCKRVASRSIRSSLNSPPYDPNSLKKCFDYFIKVFNLIQYDLQQIDETFFVRQFESIIDELPFSDEGDFDSIRSDINENIQNILYQRIIITGGLANMGGLRERLEKEIKILAPDKEVNVIVMPNPSLSAWRGASIYSQYQNYFLRELAVSQDEYIKNGDQIICTWKQRKC